MIKKIQTSNKDLPLLEHYQELRIRFFRFFLAFCLCFFVSFFLKDQILAFLLWPYQWASGDLAFASTKLQATEVWESFLTKIRLCFFSAILLTSPIGFYQLYRFVAPGLYPKERRLFLHFLLFSPLCFLIGASFVYFCLARVVLIFSLMQQELGEFAPKIDFNLKISNYLDFMLHFIVIFGIIFQLPLLCIICQKVGNLKLAFFQKQRRWVILLSAVFAAIITPPDLLTMLCVFLPLILLYELSLLLIKFTNKKA